MNDMKTMETNERIFRLYFTGEGSGQRCWKFVRGTALSGFAFTIVLAGVAACSLVLMFAFFSGFEGISAVPASDLKNLMLEISKELHWLPVGAYSMAISLNLNRIVMRHRTNRSWQ